MSQKCGVQTRDGAPCTQPAGKGTAHKGTGPCFNHEPAVLDKREEKKKLALEIMRSDPLCQVQRVAAMCGVSIATFYQYRNEDPDFDALFTELKLAGDRLKVSVIEDTMLARCMDDRAKPVERIFVLCNLARDRWQHVNRLELTGAGGGPVELSRPLTQAEKAAAIEALLEEAAQRRERGMDPAEIRLLGSGVAGESASA